MSRQVQEIDLVDGLFDGVVTHEAVDASVGMV